MPETRGLCLSEEQTVTSVSPHNLHLCFGFEIIVHCFQPYNLWVREIIQILRRPRIGGHRLVGMRTQPQKLTRRCEVTAILVLYGLPR